MLVVTPAQMRQMDALTIERAQVPGLLLMEHAALGAVELIQREANPGARIGLLCGAGNNGGDGLAMARILAQRGFHPIIALLVEPEKLRGDALINLNAARGLGLALHQINDRAQLDALPQCAIWCDALLGTGLDRPVTGLFAAAIDFLNAQPRVFAVDIPSGLHGESGQPLGTCVKAERTITFGFPKLGMTRAPGFAYVGQLEVVKIGLSPEAIQTAGHIATLTDEPWVRQRLHPRDPLLHKGQAGRVVVMGGQPSMSGAVVMAAAAALDSGAGLITALTWPQSGALITQAHPELMWRDLQDEQTAQQSITQADVVIVGPGFGVSALAAQRLALAIEHARCLVLDADALNLLARDQAWPEALKAARAGRTTVMTPHPGEFSRLAGTSDQDELSQLMQMSARSGALIALKHARTLLSDPQGRLSVCPYGDPGMASGGMGDTLTGIIAAQLIEQQDPHEAVAIAIAVHARAGEIAAAQHGQRAVTASRVLAASREVFRQWSAKR